MRSMLKRRYKDKIQKYVCQGSENESYMKQKKDPVGSFFCFVPFGNVYLSVGYFSISGGRSMQAAVVSSIRSK